MYGNIQDMINPGQYLSLKETTWGKRQDRGQDRRRPNYTNRYIVRSTLAKGTHCRQPQRAGGQLDQVLSEGRNLRFNLYDGI